MPDYERAVPHTDALDTLGSIITPNEKRDAIHLAVFPCVAAETLTAGDHVAFDNAGCAVWCGPNQPTAVGIVDPFLLETVHVDAMFWLVVYPRQISSLRHIWEHPSFPASGETTAPVGPTVEVGGQIMTQAQYDAATMPLRPDQSPAMIEVDGRVMTDAEFIAAARLLTPDIVASGTDTYADLAHRDEAERWLIDWCNRHDCPEWPIVRAVIENGSWSEPIDETGWGESSGNMDGEYIMFNGLDAHASIPPEFWAHVSIALGEQYDPADAPESFACSC